jgi:hypothetical protein
MDQFDALDGALRSRYLRLDALPSAPIWERLPSELRTALAGALAANEPLGTVLRLLWQIRAQLLGKPESSKARGEERATLLLGLFALRHYESRLDTRELLSRAFHVADSYVCEIDARPFLRLRSALDAGEPERGRIAALFEPYVAFAEQSIQHWGLRPNSPTTTDQK